MTLLGKIFTMMIFILALMTMFFAVSVYMTQKVWKDVVMNPTATEDRPLGLIEVLKEKKKEIAALEEELKVLKREFHREKAARASALAALEEARQLEAAKREMAETTRDELLVAHGKAVAEVAATQERLKAITVEIADARTQIKAAQEDRDDKLGRVAVLSVELNEMDNLKRRLEERQRELVAQIARMENVLKVNRLDEHDNVDGIPPPLNGLVTAVQKNFLEVSIGSDDGLKVGHELDVFQGSTYKGRVVIRQTNPDRSVAEIIPDLRRGEIQKGDRVRTRTKVS